MKRKDWQCTRPWPLGWTCTRYVAHDGPCALRPRRWNIRRWLR